MRFKSLALFVVLALFAVASVASAQSHVAKGSAFKLAADSAGTGIAQFKLYRNGVVVATQPVAALAAGVITFTEVNTLAAGNYAYEMTAIGDGVAFAGESLKSNTVNVIVDLTAPPAPGNNRFVIVATVAADGTLQLRLQTAGQ